MIFQGINSEERKSFTLYPVVDCIAIELNCSSVHTLKMHHLIEHVICWIQYGSRRLKIGLSLLILLWQVLDHAQF
jgi:hypothetical protein